MRIHLLTCLLSLVLLTGCDPGRIFDSSAEIPKYIWDSSFSPEFEVEIADTGMLYNVYVNVRHTKFYQFSNLWVMIYTTLPDSSVFKKRVELELADKEGKWYGDCLGDICDIQVPIQQRAFFNQVGKHKLKVEQIMRTEELPFVMSVGFRLEKAGTKDDREEAQGK